jgi:hypothetical protein
VVSSDWFEASPNNLCQDALIDDDLRRVGWKRAGVWANVRLQNVRKSKRTIARLSTFVAKTESGRWPAAKVGRCPTGEGHSTQNQSVLVIERADIKELVEVITKDIP